MDFADAHPAAVVLGTDLSPIQPKWVPPNLKFEVDDYKAEWTYPDNYFDYIHIRNLLGCVKDWSRLYAQVMRCLKPAGYIEHAEFSPFRKEQTNPPVYKDEWVKELIGASEQISRTFQVMYQMYDWIHNAGFHDVVEKRYQWPLGPWPKDPKLKELGIWARAHVEEGLENWCMGLLTRVHGWSYGQVQAHIANARERLSNPKWHARQEMRVVYGMKPREWRKQDFEACV